MDGAVLPFSGLRGLDELVVRSALITARRHAAAGLSVSQAAELACPGVWSHFRAEVARRLAAESAGLGAADTVIRDAA